MASAGIGAQSAVGGFELAHGSKPSLHAITITGELASSGGGTVFVDKDGNVAVTGTALTAACAHGAGYITLPAVSGDVITGTWTLGTGAHAISVAAGMPDGQDDTEIIMARGDFCGTTGATYAHGIATPGLCNITKLDGGTVTFKLSNPHEDSDNLADGDGFRLTLMAWVKGGI